MARSISFVIALLAAAALPAQETGTIAGTVVTSDSALPVARARVGLRGSAMYTVARTDGFFHLPKVPPGNHTVQVRMLGFAPLEVPVTLRQGESLHVRLTMNALEPVALSAVEVTAAVPAYLRGFEERRLRGPGAFLRRDEIRRMQAREVTDVLRRVPSLQVRAVPGPYGTNFVVTQRGSRCPVLFYLNGSPFPISEVPIDNYVTAEDLMAVEAYNPSEIPPQFNSSSGKSSCGMVGLWTRIGNLPDKLR